MISYNSNTSITTDLSTYNFTSVSFGTAAADRRVSVSIMGRINGNTVTPTITSVTIGGIAATIDIQRTRVGTNASVAAIATAWVPTGTSGNVDVVFDQTMLRCNVGSFSLSGLDWATGPITAAAVTGTDPAITIDAYLSGAMVALGVGAGGGSITGVTQNAAPLVESTTRVVLGSLEPTADESARAVAVDYVSSADNILVVTSWRPTPSSGGNTGFFTGMM